MHIIQIIKEIFVTDACKFYYMNVLNLGLNEDKTLFLVHIIGKQLTDVRDQQHQVNIDTQI